MRQDLGRTRPGQARSDLRAAGCAVLLSAMLVAGPGLLLRPVWANQDDTFEMDFGQQVVHTSSNPRPVVLSNATFEPSLKISQVRTTGDFTSINDCPAEVPPGGRCEILVTFVPRSTGSSTGRLWIYENRAASPVSGILTGVGVASAPPPSADPSPTPASPPSPTPIQTQIPVPPPPSPLVPPSPSPDQQLPPAPTRPQGPSPGPSQPVQDARPNAASTRPAAPAFVRTPAGTASAAAGSRGVTTREGAPQAAAPPGSPLPPEGPSVPGEPSPGGASASPDPGSSVTPTPDDAGTGIVALRANGTVKAVRSTGGRPVVLSMATVAGLCGTGGIAIRLRRRR